MLEILAVAAGSIAAELELEAGDVLLAINGAPLRDLIDLRLGEGQEELFLEVRKQDGTIWDLELEKDAAEPLGVEVVHPAPAQCGNQCLFCFVHQLPKGLRQTLYVKDEDYRFSYLYGAYVTLSNIGEEEIARILQQRLSPLYVSVHASDQQIRTRLLGRAAPPVLPQLQRLIAGGIELHTQIVVCPGINDGVVLEQTIADLAALAPGVRSLAVVPVGLTGHRRNLPVLRIPTRDEAAAVLDRIAHWQHKLLTTCGSRLVFAADEFYLLAGRPFPPLEDYETLPQIENGVGLIPLFRAEGEEVLRSAEPLSLPRLTTVTGASFAPELTDFVARLNAVCGSELTVVPVVNHFFGGEVSVTGLISGRDIVAALQGRELGEILLLPDVLLRDGEEVLLDDMTPDDVARELGVEVRIVEAHPWGLLTALEELHDERREQSGG